MSENLQNEVLSKKNIKHLFDTISQKNEINLKNNSDEKKLLNILMEIMKVTFKSIDKNKINNNNYISIKKQFNNICITKTLEQFNPNNNVNVDKKILW